MIHKKNFFGDHTFTTSHFLGMNIILLYIRSLSKNGALKSNQTNSWYLRYEYSIVELEKAYKAEITMIVYWYNIVAGYLSIPLPWWNHWQIEALQF